MKTNIPILSLFLTSVLLALFTGANAQSEQKLLASDGEANDQFGIQTAISGDYIIVGCPFCDGNNIPDAGTAYVFKREGTTWTEVQKIVPEDTDTNYYFGYDVDMDGEYAVITACWDDMLGEKTGSAYIYKLEGTTWVKQTKLTALDASVDDRFGISAAMDGNFVIVGAFFDDNCGEFDGSAYLFERVGDNWIPRKKLINDSCEMSDQFGVAVDIEGDYSVVSSYRKLEGGNRQGRLEVYRRDGDDWIKTSDFVFGDPSISKFAIDPAIEGDNIFVAARLDNDQAANAGACHVFVRYGENWLEADKLYANDPAASEQFGYSVAKCGDYLAVGAIGNDDKAPNAGACYLYQWDGLSWQDYKKITPSDGDTGAVFGTHVKFDDGTLVVSSRYDRQLGNKAGAVYVYQHIPTGEPDLQILSPSGLTLYQNYPNPFGSKTLIDYEIAVDNHVQLLVYNATGQMIRRLVNEYQPAGSYSAYWDAKNDLGMPVPEGQYFCQLIAGGKQVTRAITVIKK